MIQQASASSSTKAGKGREEVLLIPHLTSAATEDKPFKCSLCEKSYKTMGWLTRHLGQAHGESGGVSCEI